MPKRAFLMIICVFTAVLVTTWWRGETRAVAGGIQVESSGPLRVSSITPHGDEVPPGRQIVFQFDRNVVPVGRMERTADEIPIVITPALDCEWRWLNTSALACQLGEKDAFRPATRYEITVRPGIETEDGVTLSEPLQRGFETERPRITRTRFRLWRSPGSPRFDVTFNLRVTEASVHEKLYFLTRSGERVPVVAELSAPKEEEPERHWKVHPRRELPLDMTVDLFVASGLVSLDGPLPSVEDKRVVTLFTFPAHTFNGIRCSDNNDVEVRIRPGSFAFPMRPCNPLRPVVLVFASPVIKDVLREHLSVDPDLAGGRDDYDPWDSLYSGSRLRYARRQNQEYFVRLPEVLRARTTYHIKAKSGDLLDEFGRPLTSDIDFPFTTDDRKPRAVLTHPVSTLETDVETYVPIVVTNLSAIDMKIQALTVDGYTTFTESIPLPDAPNVAYRFPLDTRDWLSGRSGVVIADPVPTPSVHMSPDRFFSQVTPFAAHVKLGHQNTGVWVTDMRTGEPVADARVTLYASRPASALTDTTPLSQSTTDAAGLAVLAGQAEINPELRIRPWQRIWNRRADAMLFARIEKGVDLALVPLSNSYRVQAQGAGNTWVPTSTETRYGHIRTWGTTAQGVYRLGDTIQYKIYVRNQDNRRFVPAPEGGYHLQVYDPMDKLVYEVKDMTLNDFGAHAGEFLVPMTGAVGWYRFQLDADFHNWSWAPLRVLVADFTPASFRVTTDLDGERFEPGDMLGVVTSAKLHAGGPYSNAQARITVNFTPTMVRSENPKAKGFRFGTWVQPSTTTLHQTEAAVDQSGELATSFAISDNGFAKGRLMVESAVRDDRGKYVAGRSTSSYVGRDRFVGAFQGDWLLEAGEPAELQAIVIDMKDDVASETDITFRIRYRETTASRVKGAGNAYITQYNHKWNDVTTCTAVSAADPVSCAFTPEKAGRYELTAAILDTKGRAYETTINRWARGKGQVLWEGPPGHRLDIEPEKAEYRVGDTARFLIKNPFPGAKALLTIERYGIQRHWVEVLEDSTAVIEIDVEEDHVPGFYFSAVVTSPRVEAPMDANDVDLGKPAFRMGYVQVPVKDPFKEIVVDVAPESELYKPGDIVKVELNARPRQWAGTVLPPLELAVAVLDEAVFDLIGGGESYFDPYEGFYELEPLDVENFNLLTRLIGIQKFEKKGANAGGGGGGLDMRTLFKFVSYWNPSILPDANGRATIEFEVPDNLTGWRVLVMAVSKEDRMGLGQGHFIVNKPTEIRPALPNQVTEGDRFEARFTVMNRSEEVRILRVSAAVEGQAESPGLAEMTIEAEPYQRRVVSFPVRALDPGEMRFTVRASDLVDGDALSLPLPVHEYSALEVAATYGSTMDANTIESFLFPENMRTDVGKVSVVSSPSVLSNLEGAFEYLRDYPYLCWEQKLTKGIMASHFAELEGYVRDDFTWPGHQEIPDQTLSLATNYQAPNGGMVYWIPADRYVSPYLSAYTALAFHWLRERGHSIPASVESKLHNYLRGFLRQDVFPEFYTRGMSSTVRAVALAALGLSGSLDRSDLERYRAHVETMDLFGKAHFLMAANAIGAPAKEVKDAILAHSNQSGGKFVFSEAVDVGYKRILYSPERTQCAVLSALTRDGRGAPSGSGIGDVPFRLARTVTQSRKQRTRWENTQENVFCMNGLIDYSDVYESTTPSYTLTTYFDGEKLGQNVFADVRDEPVEHVRPIRPSDPGQSGKLRISKLGPGRLYYAARLFYSPQELKKESVNSGIEVRREYSVQRGGEWALLQEPMRIRAGELVKVDLFLSLPAPRNFVVVDDPVPGGLEPVNRDLATASTVDADEGNFQGAASSFWFTKDDWFWYGYSRWSFYHKELRHDGARFFSEYLPAGNYHLSYTAQAIAPGEFQVLPLHAEEMYDPDIFGQGVPGTLIVEPME